ncbi:MAG TPA: hypothetical protein ENI48_00680 [Thioploca sp.]|nr:hypothetical protein [Thioploca sp.]
MMKFLKVGKKKAGDEGSESLCGETGNYVKANTSVICSPLQACCRGRAISLPDCYFEMSFPKIYR